LEKNFAGVQNQHRDHITKLEDDQQRLFTLMIQLTQKLEMITNEPQRKRSKTAKENSNFPVFPIFPLHIDK